VLNMCDLFEDDYKEFVLGELTELWDSYRSDDPTNSVKAVIRF